MDKVHVRLGGRRVGGVVDGLNQVTLLLLAAVCKETSLALVHCTMPVLESGLLGRTSILVLPMMDTVGATVIKNVIYFRTYSFTLPLF